MRFRTRSFITSSLIVLLLWAATLWPIERTISSSFQRQAAADFEAARQGLHALRMERVDRMGQAGRLVVEIPLLRALIADSNAELTADNLQSLQERLDNLAHVLGVEFICALDERGSVIAQNSSSPWAAVPDLRDYIVHSSQALPLVRRIYAPRAAGSAADSGDYGLWVFHDRLYQVVGLPLVFSSQSDAGARPDGALVMATQMSDSLAQSLAPNDRCDITFLSDSASMASSLPPALRDQLLSARSEAKWPISQPFDLAMSGSHYRAYLEPLVDPCSREVVGATIYQSSLAGGEALLRQISRGLLAIMSAGLLLAALLSYLLSGAITRPVRVLVAGARRVAGGDLNSSIEIRGAGEFSELGAAFNDMVTQLRTRRDLERLVEKSEAASRAKSQFLANMSHEIRTPLHGITGMTNLLLGAGLDPRQRHYAALIKSSSEVLATLINDILDFSKIEAGKLEIESIEFNLHTVVEDVLELLSRKAFEKGLQVAADIAGDVPVILRGDCNRVRQILMNLVGNAVKFTKTGQVIVRVRRDQAAIDRVGIHFAIEDSGIGIPPDRMHRLFQSFSQVDASTTRRYGGTGLGLAICKQLVELMGGKISVTSQPGRGSEFSFTIPFQPAESPQPPADQLLAGACILVVEDNDAVREILCRQLEQAGARSRGATNIAQASLLLTEAPAAVVLVDQHVEGAAGFTLASELGAKRVLLISAADDLNAVHEEVGYDGAIVKPVRRGQMLETLEWILGKTPHPAPSPAANPGANCAAVPVAAAQRGVRILVAEDNEVNQLVAREVLEGAGFNSLVVSDGGEAVEAFKTGRFDLVLMDCQMPRMDGLEATRAIRNMERQRRAAGETIQPVPIVALTANASGADRQRCLEAGMNAYQGKPFVERELLQTIVELLSDNPVAPAKSGAPAAAAVQKQGAREADNPDEGLAPIDIDALLRQCRGKGALAMIVLQKFQKQSELVLRGLTEAFEKRDAAELSRLAHSLKGAAGAVAAGPLHSTAAKMEALGRAGDLTAAESVLNRMSDQVRRCTEFLPAAHAQIGERSGKAS